MINVLFVNLHTLYRLNESHFTIDVKKKNDNDSGDI